MPVERIILRRFPHQQYQVGSSQDWWERWAKNNPDFRAPFVWAGMVLPKTETKPIIWTGSGGVCTIGNSEGIEKTLFLGKIEDLGDQNHQDIQIDHFA